jgi:hypothetical protein
MQVKNVKKQVVAGMRYVFTVDVLSAPKKGQYGVSLQFFLFFNFVIIFKLIQNTFCS